MPKRLFAESIIVVVCLAVVLGFRPVSAQFQRSPLPPPNADPRMISTKVTMDQSGSAWLIRDTKTSGCWLEVREGEGYLLAPAPPEACAVASSTGAR
jgi:hypothetical protein